MDGRTHAAAASWSCPTPRAQTHVNTSPPSLLHASIVPRRVLPLCRRAFCVWKHSKRCAQCSKECCQPRRAPFISESAATTHLAMQILVALSVANAVTKRGWSPSSSTTVTHSHAPDHRGSKSNLRVAPWRSRLFQDIEQNTELDESGVGVAVLDRDRRAQDSGRLCAVLPPLPGRLGPPPNRGHSICACRTSRLSRTTRTNRKCGVWRPLITLYWYSPHTCI